MPLKLWLTMSLTLFLLFGFLFGLLAAIGYYFEISGYIVVFFAVLLVFLQWLIGPKIIWWTTNMRPLEKQEYPWLWKTVESLCKKNKTPVPRMALARSGAPNAFVFGRTPGSATLTVTQGLLNNLSKDEVKAVVAHEVGHIKHKDMIVMTIVAAIPVIAYFVARFLIFAPKRDERKSGGAALIGIVAFIIYFISNLLVLMLSRLREFYADKFGGENTRPGLLASALAKITYGLSISEEKHENSAVRSFFIADPIAAGREVSQFSSEYSDLEISDSEVKKAMEWERKNPFARISEIFRTHPLTYKRIAALKELEKEIKESQ
jgi:heat shock protein HtpX